MRELFKLADYHISREQVCNWLKKDDDPLWQNCPDTQLAIFLNGVITDKRGKKEGPPAEAEKRLNNNIVLRKLKIAFDLTSEEVVAIIELAGQHLSQHELSAFFRRPDHKHYRPCHDQVLRSFLRGLQMRYRPQGHDLSAPVNTSQENT
jgi:uncharacterized protein YehS (DUF1456 family)